MQERNYNLDLIRSVAVIFVLSVHFFLNSGFYGIICEGEKMFVMCVLRTSFITCVPLFLMLTGYLMCKKELSLKYFKGIKKTYFTYVIVCLFCLAFRILYLKEDLKIGQIVLSVLDFSANSYSWYIEMYIGLFLMIPFLNILWNNTTHRQRKWLLLILFSLTAVPSMFNCWNFFLIEGDSRIYNAIIPEWWQGSVYIFFYYFLGAYFRDDKEKKTINIKHWLLLLGIMVLFGGFTYFRSYKEVYEWTAYNSYYGVQVIIIAFLMFEILLYIPMQDCPKIVKRIVVQISKLSLGIYLASNISDKLIYPYFAGIIEEPISRMIYFPIIVLGSFIIATVLSAFANIIYFVMEKTYNNIKSCFIDKRKIN